MNTHKCPKCSLVSFSADDSCRRCGTVLSRSGGRESNDRNPTGRPGFSLGTLIVVAVAAGIGYFAYNGVTRSIDDINASEANRIAAQPKQQPAPLSRTEYDQQRAGQYKNAVAGSNSLAESQRRNEETQKMMEASQGTPQR